MRELVRDIALSFCPESARRVYRPASPSRVLRAAILAGPLQTLLFGKWFVSGYLAFLALRGQQLAPAVERMNQTTQGWFAAVLSIEYVAFHPLALLQLYLAAEGFIRFVGGVAASEVVPSLPVVLFFRIRNYFHERRIRRDLDRIASIPDSRSIFPTVSVCGSRLVSPKPVGMQVYPSASMENGMKWGGKRVELFPGSTFTF